VKPAERDVTAAERDLTGTQPSDAFTIFCQSGYNQRGVFAALSAPLLCTGIQSIHTACYPPPPSLQKTAQTDFNSLGILTLIVLLRK
jgi:hypothetical protein